MMQESYSFQVLQYPFAHSYKNSALYNTEKFLGNYPTDAFYRLVMIKNNTTYAQVNLHIRQNEALNAVFSGFGGIEHELSDEMLQWFIQKLLDWCSEQQVLLLKLKLPAPFYVSNAIQTERILTDNRFEVLSDELNQHIVVSSEAYQAIIRKNERKRLRKCREAGFKFKQLSPGQLQEAYELIKDNRLRRGFPVTMTFEALDKMYHNLPENYLLFGVYDKDRLIATAVSIRVSNEVLYNFYHGDAADYRSYSPVVMLLDGVYAYCQEKKIKYLDLGISSVNGEVNEGLLRFKRNCGCRTTSKKVMIRHLQE
ncbi:hypothetical protein C900_04061 [Fulvivirga imtechensis AK7]|uniref:BioF2-like acetyltransferase domain-containing protein n=1 Tax=Fulvivirga imtechensis AK7 TaxID=1237149 RepID=L8JN58_9BACT|nr:GNAT family N-acetyltransferase [Fulvivirga imtechensis]ELR70376.1 hypothetical protein C900_04061 [Fulvivirga imtechensis AK7]